MSKLKDENRPFIKPLTLIIFPRSSISWPDFTQKKGNFTQKKNNNFLISFAGKNRLKSLVTFTLIFFFDLKNKIHTYFNTFSRYSPDLLHAEDITPFLRFPTLLIVEGEGRYVSRYLISPLFYAFPLS